jgi:predicted O-methyltransferase YrrM
MTEAQWAAVEHYFVAALAPPDPVLDSTLKASEAGGLPPISVAPNEGKQLQLLALVRGARSILEVGTLGGYSTIWLARALPEGGRLVTLEVDEHHAEVARANLANAGLAGVAEVIHGAALQTLPDLVGPFDLVFIDADKPSNADYFAHAMRLSRPGTVIVVDNVVRGGAVIDASSDNAAVQGVRRLVDVVSAEPRVSATVIQTVGSKGYDGYLLAVVTS